LCGGGEGLRRRGRRRFRQAAHDFRVHGFHAGIDRQRLRRARARRERGQDGAVTFAVTSECVAPKLNATLGEAAVVVRGDDQAAILSSGALLGRRHSLSLFRSLDGRELTSKFALQFLVAYIG
jgi:hypothetical protein